MAKSAPTVKSGTGTTSLLISLVAIVISALGFWNAREALKLSEASSLPELSETSELLQPLAPGQAINLKITIANFGHTTARHMTPYLGYSFAKADVPFDPTLSRDAKMEQAGNTSDLAPGDHTTLVTTSKLNLMHDHDVAAVLSGEYHLSIFGRVPYKDVMGRDHEFHFCRLITGPVPGADPMKPLKCSSFNYSY